MSTELINGIAIRKDGVYLSSHSSNDSLPFHFWRCGSLSEIYTAEGQKGLDREILRMLYEYAKLCGSHKSLARYRYALNLPEAHSVYEQYINKINDRYGGLEEADKKSIWYKPTEKAKEFRAYEREMRNKMYSEIAAGCEEYDKKHRNRDYER